MARKIRPSTLKRMSGDQLKKAGYVRIPGFTKKDGTKVKSHIRMLNPAKGGKEVSKQLAEFAIDMTPIIGDIKAFKEAKDAFSQGDIGSGFLLAGAGTIGLVPGVGDAIAAPIKMLAKSLKKVKLPPIVAKRVEIREEYLKKLGPVEGDVDVYIHTSYAKNLDIDNFNYRAINSKAKRGHGEGQGIFTHSGTQNLSGYGDKSYAVVVNRKAKIFNNKIDEATDINETFIKVADVKEIRHLGKTVDIGNTIPTVVKVSVPTRAASVITKNTKNIEGKVKTLKNHNSALKSEAAKLKKQITKDGKKYFQAKKARSSNIIETSPMRRNDHSFGKYRKEYNPISDAGKKAGARVGAAKRKLEALERKISRNKSKIDDYEYDINKLTRR